MDSCPLINAAGFGADSWLPGESDFPDQKHIVGEYPKRMRNGDSVFSGPIVNSTDDGGFTHCIHSEIFDSWAPRNAVGVLG